jgi:hypothetical protein
VVITTVSMSDDSVANAQDVHLHLHNNGGAGQYYLEFWSLPTSPNGQRRLAQSGTATVLTGYDESVAFAVGGCTLGVDCDHPLFALQAVKVKSRAENTAAFTQSDCKIVGTETSYCP